MKKLLLISFGFLIISSCKDKDKDKDTPPPPPPIAVANISLSPSSLTLKVDDASTLKAVITPENAANKLIEWSSSNAVVATVSQDGEVKAVKEGEAIITAKSKANPDKTATCKVAVSPKVPMTRIVLDPATASVILNETLQIVPALTPANTTESLNWTSSDTKLATVSATGLVTALALGQATITASASYSNIKTTCQITITDKPVPVESIRFSSPLLTLKMGDNAVLAPVISPTNATNRKVRFVSDRPNIVSVSDKGVITANSIGESVITVTTDDGGKMATCTVMVNAVAVTGVSLSPTQLTFRIGQNQNQNQNQSQQLQATIEPSNAANKTVVWSSSAESIASVSPTGLVTAKGPGTAIITVTTNDENKTASCTVTVSLLVSAIALTPNPASVVVGSRVQLRTAVTPENASNKTVTWSSSDVSKATVDQDGWVTGVAKGAVTITATATDAPDGSYGRRVQGEATLTVKSNNASVSAITLGAENLSVAVPAEGATTLANAPRTISSNLAAVPVNIPAEVGATIKIGTAAFTQGQAVDFTNPVTFTITAEDGTTVRNYSVSIPAYNATANPYGIYTVKDLVDVKNGLSDSFLLKNVIALPSANAEGATATGISDYGASGWLPLGPFTGTFDGGNFSITNFYANRTAEKVGLFGELGSGGTIRNLTTNSSTERSTRGSRYTGILVGYSAGTIDKCSATGNVSFSSSYYYYPNASTGGLVGYNAIGSSISNSYATGSVSSSSSSSSSYAGGLVGYSTSSISNSYATGSVSSSSSYAYAYAGGLVGKSSGSIRNSYATGNTTSSTSSTSTTSSSTSTTSSYAGGLVGYSEGSTISNNYATGNASSSAAASSYAGGLVGCSVISISNSYATGNATATTSSSSSDYSSYAGGLVGSSGGSISNSYATGNTTTTTTYASSSYYAGGLVGYSWSTTISNSYATGSVSSSSSSSAYAGGLVGYSTSSISNSYATGSVSSSSSYSAYAGGLVGYSEGRTISNSYATGSVSSSYSSYSSEYAYAGGLVGRNYNGSYTNCYHNSNATVSPTPTTYITDIIAKTKAEMQSPSFVTSLNSGTGVWGRGAGKNDDLPFIRGVGVGK